MNFPGVLYILGWVISGFGAFMMVPAVVTSFYGDGDKTALWETSISTAFLGICLVLMTRGSNRNLSLRDGVILTVSLWVSLAFIGAIPLHVSGVAPSLIDAFFEATSALTTTGATVLVGLDGMDHGVLLWRAMMQWLGGMGIVVLAIAILPFLGIGGMQLYKAEMPGVVKDKLQPRLKETAKLLWFVYFVVTFACMVSYMVAGMGYFDAITHAFTTISTGGFSTYDSSLGHFNSFSVELVAMIFMLIGGINFSLHFMFLLRKDFRIYSKNSEIRFFFSLIAVVIGIVSLSIYISGEYESWLMALRYASFNVISVITTTGFATVDYSLWPVIAPMTLLGIMFCGGCSGSTSGGMKAMRVMLLIKQSGRELFRLLHPRAIIHVKIGRATVPDNVMQAVWSFAGMYIISFIILSIIVSSFGVDQITAFSAVAACITSVGPGLGDVGPAANYADMPQGVKAVLAFAMYLGRLEMFTLLLIFTPAFWRK